MLYANETQAPADSDEFGHPFRRFSATLDDAVGGRFATDAVMV
jgi:hypothetical protein